MCPEIWVQIINEADVTAYNYSFVSCLWRPVISYHFYFAMLISGSQRPEQNLNECLYNESVAKLRQALKIRGWKYNENHMLFHL